MSYIFQQATTADIPEIVAIANMHYYTMEPGGYLISEYDTEIVTTIMNKPNSIIYVTKKQASNEVIAFIILSTIYDSGKLNGLSITDFNWLRPEDKDIYTRENHWHMEQGAVKKGFQNQGVGHFYYKELFRKYSTYSFSSNVIKKPVENKASIHIKKSHNFRLAATFSRAEFKQLHDYQSVLFVKDPTVNNKL